MVDKYNLLSDLSHNIVDAYFNIEIFFEDATIDVKNPNPIEIEPLYAISNQ
jgi:hypothetical protein